MNPAYTPIYIAPSAPPIPPASPPPSSDKLENLFIVLALIFALCVVWGLITADNDKYDDP